jgi:class 3 adenylate cyclase
MRVSLDALLTHGSAGVTHVRHTTRGLGATMMKGTVVERFTYMVSRMVINIALRLCALGQQGAIRLSAATAHLMLGQFPLHGPVEQRVKHVRETLLVYQSA